MGESRMGVYFTRSQLVAVEQALDYWLMMKGLDEDAVVALAEVRNGLEAM